jgi:hypothetical protein
VLKAYSGDPERLDRGSRPPVYLRSPRLSIGLSPQPDVLRGLAAKPGFRGRGLLGRFLYLLTPRRWANAVWNPTPCRSAYTRLTRPASAPCWIGSLSPTNRSPNRFCDRLSKKELYAQ